MTLRDLLLVIGTLPLLGVVALRLAAEMGYAGEAPPPDALSAALGAFGIAFVLYVALTLRSIARSTRAILERESNPAGTGGRRGTATVSDFAVHLDRTAEVDLRPGVAAADPGDTGPGEGDDERGVREPEVPETVVRERKRLIGEVGSLLTRIPSARSR